ncbi:uncharacterized protein LOC135101302 [Scylla paramamosain]|uniref:uncharacterized protein LOC135101302 n=1 Tax=Scylla paramamosain TaxID=85552 RepID=UPI003082C85E
MTVIDPPDHAPGHRGPEIQVSGWGGTGPVEVQEGQQVEAQCVARGAYPHAAHLVHQRHGGAPAVRVEAEPETGGPQHLHDGGEAGAASQGEVGQPGSPSPSLRR